MNSEFRENIDQLLTIVNECTDAFRTGDAGLGYKKIIEVTENTILLFNEVEKADLIDNSIHNLIMETNVILNQINEALFNRDDVLIPDLLQYEFIPLIEQWKTMEINEIRSEEHDNI